MRSSSADARGRRTGRALLAAVLAGGLLAGPAVGYATARFGASATVTFRITVAGPDPAPPAPVEPAPAGPTDPPPGP